jgi:hypothetical protein
METKYTYYKNSNTGEVLMKQHFSVSFKCDDFFYDSNRKWINSPDLTGFVEISEKKFNRECKKKEKEQQKIKQL